MASHPCRKRPLSPQSKSSSKVTSVPGKASDTSTTATLGASQEGQHTVTAGGAAETAQGCGGTPSPASGAKIPGKGRGLCL